MDVALIVIGMSVGRSVGMKCSGIAVRQLSRSATSELAVYCLLFEYSCHL